MDIAQATQQDIVKDISGKSYTFKHLTMRDIGQLASKKQQIDMNSVHVHVQALKDAGVKPDQLPAVIKELTKPPTYADIVRWSMTPEGAMQVLGAGCADAPIDESIDHNGLHFLALDLMGIEYEHEEVEPDGNIPFSQTSERSAM